MTLRNGKVQDQKFRRFENKWLKILSKHFAENGNGKLSPNNFYFQATWKIPNWILFWQPKFNIFFQLHLLAISNVLHFSTKNKSVIISKMTKFWRKKLGIFHNVKLIFLTIHLLLMLLEENFSQEYVEIGIINISHNVCRAFWKPTIKHSNHLLNRSLLQADK